jgi:hypothetical protein
MRSTAMAILVLAIAAGGVPAQNAPPAPSQSPPVAEGQPSTEGRSIPRAPTGNRQPTMKDLPPDLAERQRSGEPMGPPVARDLDRQLQICRGC